MRAALLLFLVLTAEAASAQHEMMIRARSMKSGAEGAERAVQAAGEQLERIKPIYERDLKVLAHLRTAQEALADAMQPAAAIEKAWDNVDEAKRLLSGSVGPVIDSVRDAHAALESARRSPTGADFDRLRGLIWRAIAPATRTAAKNALDLEEHILEWIKVQQMISSHLRRMSEIAGDSLRAAQ